MNETLVNVFNETLKIILLEDSNYTLSNETNVTSAEDSPTCYSGIKVTESKLPPCKHSYTYLYHYYIIAAFLISIICIFIIFYVYITIPELKNLHGEILLSLSGCLAVAYIFLILDFMLRTTVSLQACITIGVIIHISFLASFFWTNIMAYDVWRTISQIKAKTEVCKSRKYLRYAAYAWTATITVALPSIILDNVDLLKLDYKPKFGFIRCWLSGRTANDIYFNAPVGAILLANLIMFIRTTRTLLQVKNATMILKMKKDKNQFHLYIKLFSVMGLIWATQVFPWITAIHKHYTVAAILQCLPYLHGLYLFLIFICKRKVFQHLRDHWAKSNTKVSTSNIHKTSQPTFESYLKSSSSSDNVKSVTTMI